jgi:hypothetical protein
MIDSDPPLLQWSDGSKQLSFSSKQQALKITRQGLDVLQGKSNWLVAHRINRWIGGVHLTPDNVWFWDAKSKKLTCSN